MTTMQTGRGAAGDDSPGSIGSLLNSGAAASGGAPGDGGGDVGTFRLDMLGGSAEAIGPAPKRHRLSTQSMFLTGLIVAGAGVLLVMRQMGVGPLKSLGEENIDYDLNKQNQGADHTKVLADLSTAGSAVQVPADQVQKNPFRMPASFVAAHTPDLENDAPEPGPSTDPAEVERQRLAERKAELESELGDIRINGIVSGSAPAARLNDEMVRVGDTVGSFIVQAIRAREVDLIADGMTFTIMLDLSDDQGRAPARPARKRP